MGLSIRESDREQELAEIVKDGGRWLLRDLGGSVPVEFEGKPVFGWVELRAGGLLRIGDWAWQMPETPDGVRITLQGVSYRVPSTGVSGWFSRGGRQNHLLKDVTLQIGAGEFVGILGPSGAGKSTLLHILNGDYPASEGRVWFDGQTAATYLRSKGAKLAYLPQSPFCHDVLTPRQAIDYTLQLRGLAGESGDFSTAVAILESVGLSSRADLALRKLSGGERKRAALAVELLGTPAAVFLDEPTSGLDPARDREMMQLFRQVADSGKTVVCVTHYPGNLRLCDRLIVVAQAKVVFQGSPEQLLSHFRVEKLEDIYAVLIGKDLPSHSVPVEPIVECDAENADCVSQIEVPGLRSQFFTLAGRYLRIQASDPLNILTMLLQAPIIAGVIGATFGKIAVDYSEQHAADWKQVGFLLVMSVVWCAATNGVREIVKERNVYEHEKRYGLNDWAYVLSKFVWLGVVGIVQSLLLLLVLGRIVSFAGDWSAHYVILALLALASSALGLCISAFVKTSEQAMTVLPVVLIAEAVLSGGLARLTGVASWIAHCLANSFWGLHGLKGTLPSQLVDATYVSAPGDYQPPILGRGGPIWIDVLMLCLQSVAFVWLCKFLVQIRDGSSTRRRAQR